ncbi:type II CAAX endopeptidase family protein [Pontibacter sp. 13R65]|uniref:CPBP family intramembrane glutamic endopeptidase n=1 Tax=Pontibacter sp. 13R65 TaxID=3127458 RepID=UPI00301DABEE
MANHQNPPPRKIREASWPVLLAFYVGHILLLAFPLFPVWQRQVEKATGGLVNSILLSSVLAFLILVGGVACAGGRLRLADVGLERKLLLPGAVACTAIWLLPQAAGAAYQLLVRGKLELIEFWSDNELAPMLGQLVAQLLGNALFEETGYRGLLLQQLKIKLGGRVRAARALTGAVIISSLLFALMHLPAVWLSGASTSEMLLKLGVTFVGGMAWALLFHRTRNLFFIIGVHALLNVPFSLYIPNPLAVILTLVLAMVVAWRHQKQLFPVSEGFLGFRYDKCKY